MGNMHCPPQDAARLAAVARDFCPFPDYSVTPHFAKMMSMKSSVHIMEHYSAVQASLTPEQQQAFTQSLRSTFGQEGKVSYGGIWFVALSLAVLFDTVARQVKGEYVSDQEPVPGLFLRDPRGYYARDVYTISKYLRLVPYIANNPTMMQAETLRCLQELNVRKPRVGIESTIPKDEDITAINTLKCEMLEKSIKIHYRRAFNETFNPGNSAKQQSLTEDPSISDLILNLNCDPEEASEKFLAAVDTFNNRTKEAFNNCRPDSSSHQRETAIENIALLNLIDTLNFPLSMSGYRALYSKTLDFDLKANALGNWN